MVLGFVAGRDAVSRPDPERRWLGLAALSLAAFLAVRLPGGYGNAYAFTSYTSLDFWSFAKYPPDLAFLTWSFAVVFLALALLRLAVPRRRAGCCCGRSCCTGGSRSSSTWCTSTCWGFSQGAAAPAGSGCPAPTWSGCCCWW